MEKTQELSPDLRYNQLPPELSAQIADDIETGKKHPRAFREEDGIRRDPSRDKNTVLRPASIRDIDKIMYIPLYNRYADKTQVFSFFHNDDITRRGLHVQLVSRIARNIGRLLGLNLDLIEAMALGHDLGHTPFGHGGESFLNKIIHQQNGTYFNHNVQSERVLDRIFHRNIMLQTLDGILCHNGEFEQQEYRPDWDKTFEIMDREIAACYTEGGPAVRRLTPATLEGCVVRLSDMIAYLGKDRQDAITAKLIPNHDLFETRYIGTKNALMINNLVVDIVENSYGKDYISMSSEVYEDLKLAKEENYRYIYNNEGTNREYGDIEPMFSRLFHQLRADLDSEDRSKVIYRHHVELVERQQGYYGGVDYLEEDPDQIVVDYMASMTDDYFLELYRHLFEEEPGIEYHSYFRRGKRR